DHFVHTVDLLEAHRYLLVPAGRHVLPDVVRPDWQLAVPTVHQAQQLNGPRSAQVDQRVQGRAYGAPGEQDIVHQDHCLVGDVDGDLRWAQRSGRTLVDVIAIQRDIQLAEGHHGALELQDGLLNAASQRDSARA